MSNAEKENLTQINFKSQNNSTVSFYMHVKNWARDLDPSFLYSLETAEISNEKFFCFVFCIEPFYVLRTCVLILTISDK